MSDLRILITGAAGRMGRTLIRAIVETDGLQLAGAVERVGTPELGEDAGTLAGLKPLGIQLAGDPTALTTKADAIIDFSSPAASVGFAALAAENKIVHVIGTTGFSAGRGTEDRSLRAPYRDREVGQYEPRRQFARRAHEARRENARQRFRHRNPRDAPQQQSGRALRHRASSRRSRRAGRGIKLNQHKQSGRDGHTGARKAGDIGFATLRGGSVVGDHTVIFAGSAERIELSHKAEDRMIFARGALAAAKWGKGKKAGLYSMTDVLGLGDI